MDIKIIQYKCNKYEYNMYSNIHVLGIKWLLNDQTAMNIKIYCI